MSREIIAKELNSWVEFDRPFYVNANGTVDVVHDVYCPPVYWLEEIRDIEIDSDQWEAITGFSQQQGYSGPIMHPSEQLSGGMARWVVNTPGIYGVTEVMDPENADNLIGWVLLQQANKGKDNA